MHRANRFLFTLYLVLSLGITVGAIALPKTRAQLPAPLRDWVMDDALPRLLPAPDPVVVSVLYSTEKEDWLKDVAARFEVTRPTVNGRPVKLTMKMMGSREMYLAVLDGSEKPDLISPASSLQISILQDLSKRKFGHSLVNPADKAACRPILTTPLVLVAWRERATVLWGDVPGGNVWTQLHDALVNPRGWEAFGHPEWGYVKFGHTSPLKSNSGFMTILLMTYNYFGKTSDMASADILSDAGYQKWFKEVQSTISEFGDSTGTYMKDMVAYGPSRYDIAAVYESTAIEQMDNAVGRLKKKVWDATDEQIDAILADYGIPSPVEWAKPGSYIQTTTRWQVEANRKKNDLVFIPVGCTELHGRHLPSAADTLCVSAICEGVRRYTARRGAPVNLALPPLNYGGHPYHHMGMPGTVVVREHVVREKSPNPTL